MTEIYLIRHAEAEGNLYRRVHGHYDGMLTDRGLRQVEALKKRFQSVHIDAVYSSDLTRTRQTAKAVYLPKALELKLMPELREIAMGEWEDKTWGEVVEDYPEQYEYYNSSPDKWTVGEDWEALKERMAGAILKIARENEGAAVAVFSHGCAIRALLSYLMNVEAKDIRKILYCDNTAVCLLNVENGNIELKYFNDSSHLPDDLTAFRHETWWKTENGTDNRNMRIDPFDVSKNREKYLARYRDAWTVSHGSDKGFSDIYYDWALMRSKSDAGTVAEAKLGGRSAGMIELAPESGAEEGYGHIAFLCMDEEFRSRGLGVQLIGYAVSYYRALGRKKLRLRVSETNETAIRFYGRCGFVPTEREPGSFGEVIIMEKGIALP